MDDYVWRPPSPRVLNVSRVVFGSRYRLPVIAGIARLRAAELWTYEDVMYAAGVQYPDVRREVHRLRDAGLVELVDDEWRHLYRAVESPLWESFAAVCAEVVSDG